MKNAIKSIEDFKAVIKQTRKFCLRNGRPFVTISYAQSVDGSIAKMNKEQMPLSGPESMILTHQLRACCDSILVGIGTVLADDPSLTVRLVDGANPQPIVLDTRLRTPLNANLVRRSDVSTWIVNANHNMVLKNTALQKQGATLIDCRTAADGMIDLWALMKVLAKRQVNNIMVEGGAKVITSFVKLKLVDFFVITVAPKLVGGLPVIDAKSFKAVSFLELEQVHYQKLGDDLIIWARPHRDAL